MSTYGSTYPGIADSGATPEDTGNDKKAAAADAAKQTAGTAKEKASEVADTASQKTGEVAQTAKDQARNVLGEATEHAKNLTGELRTQASDQAIAQRDRASGALRSVSQELQEMADSREQGGVATNAVREISTRTGSLADYLEGREPTQMIDDLRDFARRRPGTFLIGAALAGVIAGRLFKGASSAAKSDTSPQTFGGQSSLTPAETALPTTSTTPTLPPVEAAGREAVGERYPTSGPLSEGRFS